MSAKFEQEECAYDKDTSEFADIVSCGQGVEPPHATFPHQYIRLGFTFEHGLDLDSERDL